MVSAFAWHGREPRFDPQLRKIIICIFFISCYYLQSFSRELNCNNCLPDNTSSLMYKSHCQNLSKFLPFSYIMKTADVTMTFFSSHDTTDHTC